MPMQTGSRVGPYEILSLLGIGGMGEVYKARDSRLDRAVAIKLLRAEVAERPDRRARFEKEARATSSLTHPHICRLYDVGEDESGRPFIVIEYLEGETLDDRLMRGPLPAIEVMRRSFTRRGWLDDRRPCPRPPHTHRPPRPEAEQCHADSLGREAPRLRACPT